MFLLGTGKRGKITYHTDIWWHIIVCHIVNKNTIVFATRWRCGGEVALMLQFTVESILIVQMYIIMYDIINILGL